MRRHNAWLGAASILALAGFARWIATTADGAPRTRPANQPIAGGAGEPIHAIVGKPAEGIDLSGPPPASLRAEIVIDAAGDTAWHALPRVTKDLVARLLQTHQCDATLLYRSTSFNPRDCWLAPATRSEIADSAAAGARRIEALRSAAAAARDREFAALHAAGKTIALDLSSLAGQTDLQEIGPAPVFADIDGRTFVAASNDVPDTIAAAAALTQASAALCTELAHGFARYGTLEPDELARILERASSPRGH